MGKRSKALIITVVCVVLLGGVAAYAAPAIYRDFIAEPAAKAPMLSADDSALAPSASGPLDPSTLSGQWNVTTGSFAGYRVDEVLNGSNVTVTGRSEQVTGSLTLDGLTLQAAQFEVDVASIRTDSSQRDRYFSDQALRASANPKATFVLTTPVTIATAPKAGEVIEQQVEGDLTIAGVTKPVSFTVQLRSDGASTHIAGQIPITFADYGVEAPNLGFVSVEPTGFVEFELVAKKA